MPRRAKYSAKMILQSCRRGCRSTSSRVVPAAFAGTKRATIASGIITVNGGARPCATDAQDCSGARAIVLRREHRDEVTEFKRADRVLLFVEHIEHDTVAAAARVVNNDCPVVTATLVMWIRRRRRSCT
jgi:hypothetical protein